MYKYTDAAGQPLFTGTRSPAGITYDPPAFPAVYRLAEFAGRPDSGVIVVGSERHVETLYAIGVGKRYIVTTIPQGCSWTRPIIGCLAGRKLAYVADRSTDDGLWSRQNEAVGALWRAGLSVRVCDSPGDNPSDWANANIAKGHEALAAEFIEHVRAGLLLGVEVRELQ